MVTVYSKPSCVQCTATHRKLDENGVEYRVVDISEDADAFAYVKSLNPAYMQAPIVVAGEDHWSGFDPNKLDALIAA